LVCEQKKGNTSESPVDARIGKIKARGLEGAEAGKSRKGGKGANVKLALAMLVEGLEERFCSAHGIGGERPLRHEGLLR